MLRSHACIALLVVLSLNRSTADRCGSKTCCRVFAAAKNSCSPCGISQIAHYMAAISGLEAGSNKGSDPLTGRSMALCKPTFSPHSTNLGRALGEQPVPGTTRL